MPSLALLERIQHGIAAFQDQAGTKPRYLRLGMAEQAELKALALGGLVITHRALALDGEPKTRLESAADWPGGLPLYLYGMEVELYQTPELLELCAERTRGMTAGLLGPDPFAGERGVTTRLVSVNPFKAAGIEPTERGGDG